MRSSPVGLSDVTIERQRGRKSRRGRDQREALFRCTMPPAVSACSVRYMMVSGLVARARDPDQRVDVLRPELQGACRWGPGPGSAR